MAEPGVAFLPVLSSDVRSRKVVLAKMNDRLPVLAKVTTRAKQFGSYTAFQGHWLLYLTHARSVAEMMSGILLIRKSL